MVSTPAVNKVLYLEGLRGLLALIVLVHHFVLLFYPELYIGSFDQTYFAAHASSFKILLAHSPLNFFMNGHFAVCVFLVISGYVLTYSYKLTDSFEMLQQHAVKRYFRLVLPVLAACLFIKFLFISGAVDAANYPRNVKELNFGAKEFSDASGFLKIIKTCLFDIPLEGDSSFLSVLWTIRIEFLGALGLFAFLLLTHARSGKIWYALVFALGLIYLSHHYVVLLLAGGMICINEKKIAQIFRPVLSKLLLLLSGAFLSGITEIKAAIPHTMYAFTQGLPFNAYFYFHDLAALLIFLVFVSSATLKGIFSFSPLARFGKLTFSIYLLHLPILYCIGSRLMWMTHGKIHPVLLFTACFLSTVFASVLFYKFVDRPAIRISNKFPIEIFGRKAGILQSSSESNVQTDTADSNQPAHKKSILL